MSSVVPTTTPLEHILDSSLIKQKKKKKHYLNTTVV